MSTADQSIHAVKEPTMRHPHPPGAGVPAAGRRVTLQLVGLDRIADLLEVTPGRARRPRRVRRLPPPFIDHAGPGVTPRPLWTDLSVAVYRIRRDSAPLLVGP